ncbi:MAG: hypothetical protein HQ526_05065, partial [Actinobacteria bacterium]|nr:hypothetical protein [Actinomycetota bacterium]
PELLATLKQGALETADAWLGWEDSSREFAAYLFGIASGTPVDAAELSMRICGAPHVLEISQTEDSNDRY